MMQCRVSRVADGIAQLASLADLQRTMQPPTRRPSSALANSSARAKIEGLKKKEEATFHLSPLLFSERYLLPASALEAYEGGHWVLGVIARLLAGCLPATAAHPRTPRGS